MPKHVISCHPSGVVESVQNDEFSLAEFGEVKMTRASDVLWSEELQHWVATIRPEFRTSATNYIYRNKSRAKAIEWEIEYLNNRTGEVLCLIK